MLRKLGLPVLALAALLTLAMPAPAKAGVHFGFYVGPSYVVPAVPYAYPAPYPYSYVPPYDYYAYPPYPGPAYIYPYGVYPHGYWYGHHDGHFDHRVWHGEQWHGHGGHEGHDRGRR
ncbi:MAG TPA: hypothetical protein VKV15_17975 [Bryobacteraceae bacterium]|nr:hypothetical protein [Bryobacteraceae bacterium]